MIVYTQAIGVAVLILFQYIVSRLSIQKIFLLFRKTFRKERVAYPLVAFIFLPGTIIHELSHAIMAILLCLKVRDIHIFPQRNGNQIKLGSVLYEKKDALRGFIVGIAPLLFGLLFLWLMYMLDLHHAVTYMHKMIIGYLIFVVSSTMFSSKQDLVDAVYLIPLTLFVAGSIYVFQIDLSGLGILFQVEAIQHFLYAISSYLLISLGIHLVIIAGSFVLFLFDKKI